MKRNPLSSIHRLWQPARTAFFAIAFCFLTLGRLPGCVPADRHDKFSTEGLKSGNATQFTRTVVTPHLDEPLARDRNVLWCATFQLAWNEVCTLIGEDIHFDNDPPMVAPMNAKRVTWADIDRASCVALAGWVRDGILDRIRAQLKQTFHGAATPQFIPDRANLRPQDIVAYGYLYKDLRFPERFERLDEPLDFNGTPVDSFGIGPYKKSQQPMYGQVEILDYQNANDFVIELNTKSAEDQVILAKISPEATLQATIGRVLTRVLGATPIPMVAGDLLQVPKFNFDIRRSFDEIRDLRLNVRNPSVALDLIVLVASQDIRFQMDEAGVKLRSESVMHFGCGATGTPPPAHRLIFDKPFLIILKRRTAKQPYFALWVENAELLVPKPAK